MSLHIEKDESTASRRVVVFRTFASNGTSPDTGSSNSSLRMSIGGAAQFTPNALVSAISANAGMYYLTLNQSDVSVLGNHPLWYEGAFIQHVATVQVVNYNPMSRSSAFTSADSVGLKAVTHSGATIRGVENYSNLSGTFSNLTVQVSGGTVAGVTNKVDLRAGNYSDVTVRVHPMAYSGLTIEGLANYSNLSGNISNLTVQVSSGTVSGVVNKVDLRAGTYSDISLRLSPYDYSSAVTMGVGTIKAASYSGVSVEVATAGIQSSSFGAGAIDAVSLAAMNLSDVTVRVHPMAYSGLTIEGLANYSNLSGNLSNLTVQVSSGTVSGVANIVQSNLTQIRGDGLAVQRLLSHLSSIVSGQAVTGQLSTTTMTSDVAEATNDHFNDRVLIFTSGALLGQATSITSFFGASNGSSRFVYPALTEAPANGDTFMIV